MGGIETTSRSRNLTSKTSKLCNVGGWQWAKKAMGRMETAADRKDALKLFDTLNEYVERTREEAEAAGLKEGADDGEDDDEEEDAEADEEAEVEEVRDAEQRRSEQRDTLAPARVALSAHELCLRSQRTTTGALLGRNNTRLAAAWVVPVMYAVAGVSFAW